MQVSGACGAIVQTLRPIAWRVGRATRMFCIFAYALRVDDGGPLRNCVSLSMHKERATSLCGTDHYFGRCDMVCAHTEVQPEADVLLRDLVLNG